MNNIFYINKDFQQESISVLNIKSININFLTDNGEIIIELSEDFNTILSFKDIIVILIDIIDKGGNTIIRKSLYVKYKSFNEQMSIKKTYSDLKVTFDISEYRIEQGNICDIKSHIRNLKLESII